MRRTYWIPVILVAAALLGVSRAQATEVDQNGVPVVSDDFENVAPGNKAVAEVGTWAAPSFGRPLGQVASGPSSPGPAGAAQGSNYLTLYPLTYSGVGTQPVGSIGANLNLTVGDVLQWSSETYIPTVPANGSSQWVFELEGYDQFNPNSVSGPVLFRFNRTAAGTWQTDQGAQFIPPDTFARDTWQNWQVTYTVGAPTLTLSINGWATTIPTDITSVDTSTPYRLFWFATGANQPSYLDAPVPYPVWLSGDLNQDGHVDSSDIQALESALANPSAYEAAHSMSATEFLTRTDVNRDGLTTNADIQALLNLLKSGGGSTTSVPEPSTAILLVLAGGTVLLRRRQFAMKKFGPVNSA